MKGNPLICFVKGAILTLIIFILIINLTFPVFYNDYVEEFSRSFDVDKYLIYSIIKAESNFNVKATSEKNAKGLMQILDETGEEVFNTLKISEGQRDLYNPKINIMVGTHYIKSLINRYENDEIKAIAAYNSGMAHADRWSEIDTYNFKDNIDFKETKNYVDRVESNHRIYKFLYEKLNLGWTSLPDSFSIVSVKLRETIRTIRRSVG